MTAASAGVVLFMVVLAALLGFRAKARLDEAALQQLAANEGERSEEAIIAANGKAALARLASGKLMVVRVMGADVSARLVAASAARLALSGEKLSVTFADTGFPPLHLRLSEAPAWIAALAAGEAK